MQAGLETADASGAKAPSAPRPWRTWLLLGLLALATLVAYRPAWYGAAVFDDDDHLTPPELGSVDGLVRIWTELGVVSQYYPVTHSMFWLQNRLWGHSMLGYHLVNIALHVVAAVLLGALLRRLQVRGAWLAAAVFALHPVQVESVAWVSELKNTLSGALYFGAALAYLAYDGNRTRRWYAVALALFGLGVLAKGVIATLPAALLVALWWKRGSLSWRGDVRPLAPFFMVGIAGGLMTAWMERKFIGAEGEAFALSVAEQLLLAGRVLWFYLGKLCWPADLVFIYPRWTISTGVGWQYAFPVAALAVLVALWLLRRRTRGPLAAALYFCGTLFPVLGFLKVYPFVYSYVADHYQYLATVGPIAAFSAGLALLRDRCRPPIRALCLPGAIAVLAVLAALTWRQSRMYAGVEELWRATIARNPGAWVAHSNLANHLLQQGRVDESIVHAQKALAIRPRIAEAHNNLGNAWREKGRVAEARSAYETALAIRPDLAVAHQNLGSLLLETGHREEARTHFGRAVELRPEYVDARSNLAGLLLEQGKADEAIAHLEHALRVRPEHALARVTLGNAFLQKDQPEAAIRHYERALAAAPGNLHALVNLGIARLKLGQPEEAIRQFERAAQVQPAFLPAQATLARVLAQQGRREEAQRVFDVALRLAPRDASLLVDSGSALLESGRVEEAVTRFRTAAEVAPELEVAHFHLARAWMAAGRPDNAIPALRRALALQPRFLEARCMLGSALLATREIDAAVEQLRQALELEPNYLEAHLELGDALHVTGRGRDALAHYRAAVGLRSDDRQALLRLAWALATGSEQAARDPGEALQVAGRASELSRGQDWLALRTIAAAHAAAGSIDRARAAAREALRVAGEAGDAVAVNLLTRELRQYERGETPEAPHRPRRLLDLDLR